MSRRIWVVLVFVCTTIFLAAEDTAAIKTKIIALEKVWNLAYKLADAKSLHKLLHDHVVLINDDGTTQSKELFLASVRKQTSREEQVSPESMSVYVYGTER